MLPVLKQRNWLLGNRSKGLSPAFQSNTTWKKATVASGSYSTSPPNNQRRSSEATQLDVGMRCFCCLKWNAVPVRVRSTAANNQKIFPFFSNRLSAGHFNDITEAILMAPCPGLPLPCLCCAPRRGGLQSSTTEGTHHWSKQNNTVLIFSWERSTGSWHC